MAPFRFVLGATDFSPEGNHAVWRAAAIAHKAGARMGIVHVVDPAGYQAFREWRMPCHQLDREEARRLAQARQLAIDVSNVYGSTPSIHVNEGCVSQEVARVAETADLLLIGRPRRRKFQDLLVMRTADQILRVSRLPVLVARNPFMGQYTRVLVPLDFGAGSDSALRAARRLAPEPALRLFHVLDSAGEAIMREAEVPACVMRDVRAREDADALARMRHHVNGLGLDHWVMHFSVGRGRFTLAASDHARQIGAELMVLARTGRWWLPHWTRANESTRLLQSTSCDVLVLPPLTESVAQSHARHTQVPQTVDHAFNLLRGGCPK